jgi:hypothetical protein
MTRRRALLGIAAALLALTGVAAPAAASAHGGTHPLTVQRHGRWTDPQNVDGVASPVSISCVTTSFCVLVDSGGNAFVTKDGVDWRYYSLIDPHGELSLSDVSCASTTFCVAVDTHGYETTFDGKKWSKIQLIDPDAYYSGEWVSCPTTTFCMAADSGGMAVTYDGTSWSQPETIDPAAGPDHAMVDFSCGSTELCAAADYLGNLVVYDGHGWSDPDPVGGYWSRISCGGSSICVVSDAFGDVSVYAHGSWSAKTPVDDYDRWFTAISCSSKVFCLAFDTDYRTFLFDGAHWKLARGIPMPVDSLSCLTKHFCAALSNYDEVAYYQS